MVFKITNTLPAFLFSEITRKFKITKKQIGFIFYLIVAILFDVVVFFL